MLRAIFSVDFYVDLNKPKIGLVNGLYATNIGLGGITTIETSKFLSEKIDFHWN